MTMLAGSCHCAALHVRLETALQPAELPVRLCGCTFCLRHRPRYTSDPAGELAIEIAGEEAVSRYRFGLRLADFLVCRACGVFVAAFEPDDDDPARGRAVVNLDVLDRRAELSAPATRFTAYDDEDAPTRRARRRRGWTPARVLVR
jgi:hypothetical protein